MRFSLFVIEGSYGCMFDLVAGDNPIIVSSLDIHVRRKPAEPDASVRVRVFSKQGSHEGYETQKSEWKVGDLILGCCIFFSFIEITLY